MSHGFTHVGSLESILGSAPSNTDARAERELRRGESEHERHGSISESQEDGSCEHLKIEGRTIAEKPEQLKDDASTEMVYSLNNYVHSKAQVDTDYYSENMAADDSSEHFGEGENVDFDDKVSPRLGPIMR